jgi:hypothetical protein
MSYIVTVNSQCLELLHHYGIEEDESLTDLINTLDDDANLLVMQGYTPEQAIRKQLQKFKTHLQIMYFE